VRARPGARRRAAPAPQRRGRFVRASAPARRPSPPRRAARGAERTLWKRSWPPWTGPLCPSPPPPSPLPPCPPLPPPPRVHRPPPGPWVRDITWQCSGAARMGRVCAGGGRPARGSGRRRRRPGAAATPYGPGRRAARARRQITPDQILPPGARAMGCGKGGSGPRRPHARGWAPARGRGRPVRPLVRLRRRKMDGCTRACVQCEKGACIAAALGAPRGRGRGHGHGRGRGAAGRPGRRRRRGGGPAALERQMR
jgi:hypothetical protein